MACFLMSQLKKAQFQRMLVLEVFLKVTELRHTKVSGLFPQTSSRTETKTSDFFIEFHNSTTLPETGCFFFF